MNNKGIGSGGDLEGNSIAIIMVLIAIVADISIVGYIISTCIKSSERRQDEKISKVSQKVSEILARYSPQKLYLCRKHNRLTLKTRS